MNNPIRWLCCALLGALLIIGFLNLKRTAGSTTDAGDDADEGDDTTDDTITDDMLQDAHPYARDIFNTVITEWQNNGFQVVVTSCYRSLAEQQVQYDKNHKNAKPGYSFHNFGFAIDVNLHKPGVNPGATGDAKDWLRKATSTEVWKNSGALEIAQNHGLKWGGDFGGYPDRVHFDLRSYYSIDELRNAAISQYGDLASAVGNQVDLNLV